MTVAFFLILLGLVLILLAGCNVVHPRVSLGWLGVFLVGLALLVLPRLT